LVWPRKIIFWLNILGWKYFVRNLQRKKIKMESLNGTMGLPSNLKISGDKLTDEERAKIESLLDEKSRATNDFEYENKHLHVLRTLRKDLSDNERLGTYLGATLGGSIHAYRCLSMKTMKPRMGVFPAFIAGGLLFDFWTASNYNLYNAVSARVNRHYSQRFSTMMDLKYD
jgi:hypothetical protein